MQRNIFADCESLKLQIDFNKGEIVQKTDYKDF